MSMGAEHSLLFLLRDYEQLLSNDDLRPTDENECVTDEGHVDDELLSQYMERSKEEEVTRQRILLNMLNMLASSDSEQEDGPRKRRKTLKPKKVLQYTDPTDGSDDFYVAVGSVGSGRESVESDITCDGFSVGSVGSERESVASDITCDGFPVSLD